MRGGLSPLIWNINFDGLLNLFQDGPVKIRGFADDASLLVCRKDPVTMVQLMQQAINKAQTWGNEHGLTFGAPKTVVVLFTNKQKKPQLPNLFLGGTKLEYSKYVKYLGIFLDSRLSYSKHITETCKKATRLMMSAKSIMGQIWGTSPQATKWLYEAMIKPLSLIHI